MNKNYFSLIMILFALNFSTASAQNDIFVLPVVGDTIDNNEKVKYLLFENIPNEDYLFSVISQNNSDTLITHFKKSDTTETKVDEKYVLSILNNINKLDSYYNSNAYQNKYEKKNLSLISNPNSRSTPDESKLDSLLTTKPIKNSLVMKKAIKKLLWNTDPTPAPTKREQGLRNASMMPFPR